MCATGSAVVTLNAVVRALGPDPPARPRAVPGQGRAPPPAVASGDVLRIEAITSSGLMVRRLLETDPATGQRRFTDRALCHAGYQTCDLLWDRPGPAGDADAEIAPGVIGRRDDRPALAESAGLCSWSWPR